MANEDNMDVVAESQEISVAEMEPLQHVDEETLHDWEMIHCSSEGWDEPSMFRCSKCGALRVSSTHETPEAEGCPGEAKPQDSDVTPIDGASETKLNMITTENGQSPDSMEEMTPEERLAKWDARSVMDILDRLEHGQLLTREDADMEIRNALVDALPMNPEGHLFKPGDNARFVGDDGDIKEFTVFAVSRTTVISDTGKSYAVGKCLPSD